MGGVRQEVSSELQLGAFIRRAPRQRGLFVSIVWASGSKIGHVLTEHMTLQKQVPFAF